MSKALHTCCACILLAVALVPLASCTDDFNALNTPDDQIVVDQVDANLVGQAFAQSQYRGMYGLHWQFQISTSLFADLYAQYFATTAENFDSDQYVEVGRWIDLAWTSFYGNAAPQIDFVEDLTEGQGLDVQNAVARIWRVQLYHRITDYWGPIIYSQFGNGETSVTYDAQEDVYKDFFQTLDEAVAVLEQNREASAFGTNDQIYGGDVNKWITFANSLRLRLAMRVRYVEPALGQSEAEKAITGGVMEGNGDNAIILTTENSRNPYTTITDWGEFRMSSAMESVLEGYEDPRIDVYYSPAADGDNDGDGSPYEGMRNGLPRTEKGPALNSIYSDMGVDWLNDNRGGSNPPLRIMAASEIYFLRAEGALEGWNMGGAAEDFYNEGIRLSMSEDRIGAPSAAVEAYISSTNTPVSPEDAWNSPPLTDIPVAFQQSADKETQLEQIITQKWLALYPDAWEAYSEYRRTGYPTLYPIINSANPDLAADAVFRRMTFVDSEFSNNQAAVEAAVGLLGGPDRNDTWLWWDVK
ncbi:MAG: SusD/RagB family nutrient-binding outer membrane lipoprotein [Rhodothermales bacterium]